MNVCFAFFPKCRFGTAISWSLAVLRLKSGVDLRYHSFKITSIKISAESNGHLFYDTLHPVFWQRFAFTYCRCLLYLRLITEISCSVQVNFSDTKNKDGGLNFDITVF